jgi:hypothetical protein
MWRSRSSSTQKPDPPLNKRAVLQQACGTTAQAGQTMKNPVEELNFRDT